MYCYHRFTVGINYKNCFISRHHSYLSIFIVAIFVLTVNFFAVPDSYASNSGSNINIIQTPNRWVFNVNSGVPYIRSPLVTTTTSIPASQIQLENGGEVTVAVSQLPSSLNPYIGQGESAIASMIESAIWPGVFDIGPGNKMVLQQSFVTSAEVIGVSPEKVEYQISPTAKWSTGEPINASDFVDMWHFLKRISPELPANDLPTGYLDINNIAALNNGTEALVTFNHPYANWNGLFSYILPSWLILPNAIGKLSSSKYFTALPSGGPFVIKSYIPGKSLLLEQNQNYFAGKSNLQYIRFLVVKSEAKLIHDFADGNVDIAAVSPNKTLNAFLNTTPFFKSTSVATSRLWQIVFNVANGPTASLDLREAITNTIDLPQLFWETEGLNSANIVINNNQLFLSGYPGSIGGNSQFQQANIPVAEQFLSTAGYHKNSLGNYVSKHNKALELSLLVPNKALLAGQLANLIKFELANVGIKVSLKYEPLSYMLTTSLPDGSFQFALAPYDLSEFPIANSVSYLDPVNLSSGQSGRKKSKKHTSAGGYTTTNGKSKFLSKKVGTENAILAAGYGIANVLPHSGKDPGALDTNSINADISGFNIPQISTLLMQGSQQLNTPLSIADYNSADTLIWDNLPTLPLFQLPEELIVREGIANVSYGSGNTTFGWDMTNWGIQMNPAPLVPILH